MKTYPFVAVAGNIGVGKTTFTKIVSKHFEWKAQYESVDDNPYLDDFYNDMERWSFNLQIYFLQNRFAGQIKLNKVPFGIIQDRTIYEDVEIFARNLYLMNFMSKRDWLTYKSLFNNMTKYLWKPDLIIYLKASTDTLISRIKNRNRDCESEIASEYLHSLNVSYEKWISSYPEEVFIVDTDNFNIFRNKRQLKSILEKIDSTVSIWKIWQFFHRVEALI